MSKNNFSLKTDMHNVNPLALSIWQIKKGWHLSVLPAVIQFLLGTLPFLAQSNFYRVTIYDGESGLSEIIDMHPLLYFLALVFCIFIVNHCFSFVHDSKINNFILSLPYNRLHLFASMTLSVFTLLLINRALSFVLMLPIISIKKVPLTVLLQMEAFIFLHVLASAALLIFFYTESANAMNAQLFSGLLNIFWPVLYWSVLSICRMMLPTFVPVDWRDSYVPTLFSPYLAGFLNQEPNLSRLLYLLAFILIFTILAYLSFSHRPAEKTAKQDLTSTSLFLTRLTISVAVGLAFTLIVNLWRDSMLELDKGDYLFLAFCYILGSVLTSIVQDLFYSRGVLRLGQTLKRAIAPVLIGLLIFAFNWAGAFALFEKIPEAKMLESLDLYSLDYDKNNPNSLFAFPWDRQNIKRVDGILLKYEDLEIDSPERMEILVNLLKEQYAIGEESFNLPRDLYSTQRYMNLNSQAIDPQAHYMYAAMVWDGDLGFKHRRTVFISPELDNPRFIKLFEDPGMRIFLIENYYFNAYNKKFSVSANPSLEENENVRRLKLYLSEQENMPSHYFNVETLLAYEYYKLPESERLRIESEAESYLEFKANNSKEKIRIPLSEDFTTLNSFIDDWYENYYIYERNLFPATTHPRF